MLYSWICSCNILEAEGRGVEGRGPRITAEAKDNGRGPRVEEHKHPLSYKQVSYTYSEAHQIS